MASPCSYETELMRAIAGDPWRDELRLHVEYCESCRMTMAIIPLIKNAQNESQNMAIVPHYRWLMLQAERQKWITLQKKLKVRTCIMLWLTVGFSFVCVSYFLGTTQLDINRLMLRWDSSDLSVYLIAIGVWLLSQLPLRWLSGAHK